MSSCYNLGEDPASAVSYSLLDINKAQSLDQLVLLSVNARGFNDWHRITAKVNLFNQDTCRRGTHEAEQ